jgi:hypothetical protein
VVALGRRSPLAHAGAAAEAGRRRKVGGWGGGGQDMGRDAAPVTVSSSFCLAALGGCENLKDSGATGERLMEAVSLARRAPTRPG